MRTRLAPAIAISLLALTTLCRFCAFGQVQIARIYNTDDVRIFQAKAYDEALTRQNSCTITLKDFAFPEVRDGIYVVELHISLLKATQNGGSPVVLNEIKVLFDDVIKNVKKDEPVQLRLQNKRVGDFFLLSDVTDIAIDVRLLKVRDEFESMMNLVKPILGAAVKSTDGPAYELVDNIAKSLQSPDDKNPLIFSTTLYVPNNIFEYTKIKSDTNMLLARNQELMTILMEGETPLNDASVMGLLKNIVNTTSTFVIGKKIISDKGYKFGGMMRLHFTKDPNPVLPELIYGKLHAIDSKINGPGDIKKDEIIPLINDASNVADISAKDKQINPQSLFTIQEYLKLATFYVLETDAKGATGDWVTKFRNWYKSINVRGAGYGVEAVGITGIYTDDKKVAKIFLPYSLDDELAMSFYLWQDNIHNALSALKVATLAEDTPKGLSLE